MARNWRAPGACGAGAAAALTAGICAEGAGAATVLMAEAGGDVAGVLGTGAAWVTEVGAGSGRIGEGPGAGAALVGSGLASAATA